jgi:putative endopeptidase
MRTPLFFLITTAFFISCNRKADTPSASLPLILMENRDTLVKPGEDFYTYANGGWIKNHPVPESEQYTGIALAVRDSVNNAIRRICEQSAADSKASQGSNVQKIGDFFASGMDTASMEKQGIEPIQPLLKEIESLKAVSDLPVVMGRISPYVNSSFFYSMVTQDDKNSSKHMYMIYQGGLGLPVMEYYVDNDEQTKSIREAYKKHLQAMFSASGIAGADSVKAAAAVYELEEKLAKVSRKIADLRDPYKNYHMTSLKSAQQLTPAFDWSAYLSAVGIKGVDSLNVGQPEFLKGFNKVVTSSSPAKVRWYLAWNVLNSYSGYLNKKLRDRNFYFYETVLSGVQKQKPRWKQVVEETNESLGELVGQEYVKNYLPPNTKDKLLEIGNTIMDVFREHLKKLEWMSAETKEKALYKLSKVNMKLGYPDKWKNFSELTITRESFCKNMMACNKWYHDYNSNKYGKPVDRDEWSMTPQTYNAYYNPSMNEIVIPGCNIIVPGYPGLAPDAILYGIVGGGTFGHEITHGFDDQGSRYDAEGNLKEWWTKEDRQKFDAKTKTLVEQFNAYTVLDSLHVKGDNTLGENIADLGGCVMGLEAFLKSPSGKKEKCEYGMKPSAEYFLGYAYGWLINRRPASAAKQIKTDVHSPAQYRVNGPLSNMNSFYEAFEVKPGQKMYRTPEQRVNIW